MTDSPTTHLRAVPDEDVEPVIPKMVDNPKLPDPKARAEKRKPVLAGWLTNRRTSPPPPATPPRTSATPPSSTASVCPSTPVVWR